MDASFASSRMPPPKSHNLFQVFLRLRPAQAGASTDAERLIDVEEPLGNAAPTHITLNPPNDRRRPIEKFAFTQVFEEDATQLDVFHCTNVVSLVEGVLAPHGGEGTDALLATLGVTGSGKTHTILGSRTQRGMTQLALDVIFRSLGHNILDCSTHPDLEASLASSDASEAGIFSASTFLESVYADRPGSSRAGSRAPTPMIVRPPEFSFAALHFEDEAYPASAGPEYGERVDWLFHQSPKSIRIVRREDYATACQSPATPETPARPPTRTPRQRRGAARTPAANSPEKHFMNSTLSIRQKNAKTKAGSHPKGDFPPPIPSRRLLNLPAALPKQPDVSAISVSCDPASEYAVVISTYEVYNDRIFDLLTPPVKSAATKEYRRRPLLFKSTEASPDRKVVAGLRKIVCGSLHQALMVLEAGLHERRVAGTGSNSTSSRSHGFFCVEVKKRGKTNHGRGLKHARDAPWGGSTLTIVDLAGSERARDAKTAGATLAEAGKINESLMYLGQCLQVQSGTASKDKPNAVPFRQCKLTELLFSNSFPSTSSFSSSIRRNPQKAVMIVAADPHGDFNATSQILRYSALAREVTVPRIPSITQTIMSAAANPPPPTPALSSSPLGSSPPIHHQSFFPSGATAHSRGPQPLSSSPNVSRIFSPSIASPVSTSDDSHRSTMELAALEIARLSEEVDYLREALAKEQQVRNETEAHLLSMEDRMLELEQAVREDCAAEFERRLEIEMARWRANMQVEMERGEEHWSRKIEVFERAVIEDADDDLALDQEDKENVLMEDVNEENERLRRDNEILRRELAGLSPSKRVPLQERGSDVSMQGLKTKGGVVGETGSPRQSRSVRGGAPNGDGGNLQRRMEKLRVSDDSSSTQSTSNGSPKKMRKLATKRWDTALDGVDLL